MTDTTVDRTSTTPSSARAACRDGRRPGALNYVPVQHAALKNARDHPHVPALRALRDARRRRRPGHARAAATPTTAGSAWTCPASAGRSTSTRSPAPGPSPARPPAPNWPGRCAELPDGTVVLLDGLVACGVPEIVVPEAERLRLAVLVHLPLGDETGLDPARRRRTRRRWSATTLRAVSAVVATSDWAVRRLVSHHGLAPDRVHVAAPGADIAPLASGTDGVSRLLCVAAVTPRKGQHRLVEALATVDRPAVELRLRRRPRPGPRVRRPTPRA